MSTAEAWVPEDTFGSRLALIRQKLRLNQSQAARLCGVSEATWRTWERGAEPQRKDEVVRKIAAATGASANWLMWGDDPITTCFGRPSLQAVSMPAGQMELALSDLVSSHVSAIDRVPEPV